MKQSTTSSRSTESSLLASSTKDETVIAQILLDLRNLMSLSESLKDFNWACRRRRSCLDAAAPLPPAASSLSPLVQRTDDEIQQRKPLFKAEEVGEDNEKGGAARTTASPDTPLSFSLSESDEKSKHSSKTNSKKRSREEYLTMIEDLTQSNEVLEGQIENVKKRHGKLKSYNSNLKAMKQEVLNACPRKEETQMGRTVEMNLGPELSQHYRIDLVHHHQPLIADPTAVNFQYTFGPMNNNGPGSVNHMGPLGFDLNIPAEEAFGVDQAQLLDVFADKRARFAEARRMRRGLIKIKHMRNACGIKLPTTR